MILNTEAGRKCNMQLKSNYKYYIRCTFAILPCCRFSPAQWPSQHVYLASVNMGWKAARDPGTISTRLVILFMQTVTKLYRREQWMDCRLMESFLYCLKTLSLMDSLCLAISLKSLTFELQENRHLWPFLKIFGLIHCMDWIKGRICQLLKRTVIASCSVSHLWRVLSV